MANKKQDSLAGVFAIDEGEVRRVTPENPLVINEDPASFGPVEIDGGDIIVQVKSTVTFASLEKKS